MTRPAATPARTRTALPALLHLSLRIALLVLLGAMLAACGGKAVKPERGTSSSKTTHGRHPERIRHARPDKPGEYTAGGLYRPGVADGGPPIPPDISRLVEPEPTDEPRARYGNRSPYSVLDKPYYVMEHAEGYVERGIASWYGSKFHGRATSSLEPYDMYQFSAAHKSLPLPTHVRVTNLLNGRSVVVRVNDRGPFHEDRLIDLSYAAAVKLGMHIEGTAPVEIRVLKPGDRPPPPPAALPAAQAWAAARAGNIPTTQGTRVQVTASTVDKSATSAPSPPQPPPPPRGRVWLQVASFADAANAQRLVDRLGNARLGESTVQRAEVGGRTVYRVRLGPFANRDASRDASESVRGMGLGVPTLISE